MESTAEPSSPLPRFFDSVVGKKVLVAVTGLVLFGYTIGHMLGNLQLYSGAAKLNAYAAFLHDAPALLWGTRAVLLVSLVVHVIFAAQLIQLRYASRPQPYAHRSWRHASLASRTMMVTGPLLGLFIVFHLLHFTGGQVHPEFKHHDVYHNVVEGFQVVPVSLFYIAAMLGLGLHLVHGAWSLFQSVGATSPRYDRTLRRALLVVVAVLVTANISFPIAVMAGLVR